jgi:hypothetical protein
MVCSERGGSSFTGQPTADDPNYKNYIWPRRPAQPSLIASSICGSTAGINLIWYSADLTLSRIAYVLEPDLNGRSYGAVYVTDDFGATATEHRDGTAALLPQWRRQHPRPGTQTAVSFSSASTPTARGPGLTLAGYISYCSVN